MKRHFAIFTFGSTFGISIFYYLAYAKGSEFMETKVQEILAVGLCGVISCYIEYFITLWLDSVLSWKTQTGIRLLIGVLINSTTVFLTIFALSYCYNWWFYSVKDFAQIHLHTFTKLGIIVFILTLLYSIIYFALHSYYLYARAQIENLQLERKQIDSQLKALKSQLSPHFLFNSLNTVSSLIFKDVERAEDFIRKLAKSYQYTLSTYNKKWVSVEEELAFVKSYQYLLKTRFQDSISFDITVGKKFLKTKIPPLTIQILVENAAKHNRVNSHQPLHIEIGNDEKWLWVRNNKTEIPQNISSHKIGLENIKSRYKILANKEIKVIDETVFIVKVPVILPFY